MGGSLALLWLVFAARSWSFCPFVRQCQPCQMPGVFMVLFRIDNCCAILQTHSRPRMNPTAQLYFSCRPVTPTLTRLLFELFTMKRPSQWISLARSLTLHYLKNWPWESITLFCFECVLHTCVCVFWTHGDHRLDSLVWVYLLLLRCINAACWLTDGNLNCVFSTIFILNESVLRLKVVRVCVCLNTACSEAEQNLLCIQLCIPCYALWVWSGSLDGVRVIL